jgi:broad specificity phosphatase PhoE
MALLELQVTFVRHGETDANAQNIYQGHCDYPLNANGRSSAHQTGEHFQDIQWFGVYSSDLSRASEVINQPICFGLTFFLSL